MLDFDWYDTLLDGTNELPSKDDLDNLFAQVLQWYRCSSSDMPVRLYVRDNDTGRIVYYMEGRT